MKTHDVAYARNVADKDAIFCVELNSSAVTAIRHGVHGVIPIDIKNVRASRTRYRNASLLVCGRWKYALCASFSNVTDEPEPSVTVHPTASSNASMRRHSNAPFNGSPNTAAKVFRCVLFTA